MIIDMNREDERKIYEVYKLLDKYLNKTKQQILDKELGLFTEDV